MSHNVTLPDRILRYLLSLVLLTWAMAGGPTWSYVGLYFLFSASFGQCAIYWALRINSRP
jgi:hypothetical protein